MDYQTITQYQMLKNDIVVLLEVENRNISELRSKVMTLRYNADELEKKLALILQELDKYNSEIKNFINRKRSLENKTVQFKQGRKGQDLIIGRTDINNSVSVPVNSDQCKAAKIDVLPSMTSTTSVPSSSTSPQATSIGMTSKQAGIEVPQNLLYHKDLSELRSCYDDIIKNMPDNYYETVQLLERKLCDTHISSIFECLHFTTANQIIMECLMERVTCKEDILDLCERLLQLKNAPQLTQIIENLRMVVDWLCKFMKRRYCNMRLKKQQEENDPWPPVKTKVYITLALMYQKDLQTREETVQTIFLRAKGDISDIPETLNSQKLTDIRQIFSSRYGNIPYSILIEGHPGIGKTTLVKEICVKWAEGKLLTSDKLLLLLLLRDPDVQRITNVQQLIQHFTQSNSKVTQLHSYLENNYGADVTLIIDGFDELSYELRKKSFFVELIQKINLPEARIVVTSRPNASACLHHIVDSRIEILGFDQTSRMEYAVEALLDCPFKLQKLQRHFQQYPNIDAICYIPLIMSIIVFLCMCHVEDLPPTASTMYQSFILHTICHYVKRTGKIADDEHINELEHLPQSIKQALEQLQKVAFDGLVKDQIVFTMDELPDVCRADPTCYGLLQSVECFCPHEIGTPAKSFNFLHLGIQEYFAAKYVATLPEDKVYSLLKWSFLVHNSSYSGNSDRFSNMWIMFCGITSGQYDCFKHYLSVFRQNNNDGDKLIVQHDASNSLTGPPDDNQQGSSSDHNTLTISQDILKDPVKVLYLFQCFQEAQDDKLCDMLSKSFDSGVIDLRYEKLLPHQTMSLGFFLSRSDRKWKELNLLACHIGDRGIILLHHYLCGDKINKQEIKTIDLSENSFTDVSSSLICDIITHRQPHTLKLDRNCFTCVRKISTAVTNTNMIKVLDISNNRLTAQKASAISNMMTCLENLNISRTGLGNGGVVTISEGITKTNTLRVLNISGNNMPTTGATAIANSLLHNTSLEVLIMNDNNISQNGATEIALAISDNKTLKKLSLYGNDTISKELAMIIMGSLHCNSSIITLVLPWRLKKSNNVNREVENINSKRRKCNMQELEVKY